MQDAMDSWTKLLIFANVSSSRPTESLVSLSFEQKRAETYLEQALTSSCRVECHKQRIGTKLEGTSQVIDLQS